MAGYIKDFRSELDSDIWMMPPIYHRVWQYLKYKVNHTPNKIPMEDGSFLNIQSGQHLTSVRNISKGVGYYERAIWKEPNPRTISKVLDWLESQEMIKINRGKGNRQYTLITLSNWGLYQSKDDESNSQYTVSTSASKQSVHINKNDKECLKNDIYTIFDFWNDQGIIKHRKANQKMESHINARLGDYSVDELKKAISNYKKILDSDEHYWTHKWSLQDFMNPNNVTRFVDESDPFNNFVKNKKNNNQLRRVARI